MQSEHVQIYVAVLQFVSLLSALHANFSRRQLACYRCPRVHLDISFEKVSAFVRLIKSKFRVVLWLCALHVVYVLILARSWAVGLSSHAALRFVPIEGQCCFFLDPRVRFVSVFPRVCATR